MKKHSAGYQKIKVNTNATTKPLIYLQNMIRQLRYKSCRINQQMSDITGILVHEFEHIPDSACLGKNEEI